MEGLLETALFLAVQQGWSWTALPQQDLVDGLHTSGHDPRYMYVCACVHHWHVTGCRTVHATQGLLVQAQAVERSTSQVSWRCSM